ncbi:hypothetical protein V1508DRAFT_193783 [Lipomyces doorenjongii]|uniref:uncharacterized protein n=1 Tax=Lipomyces doorenjongii TaxID=383834 RepID=UPI0034CD3D80
MLASSPSEGHVLLRRATTTFSASAASTSSASSAESSCPSSSNSSFCEKPVGSPTLPIALGVAIPLFVAIVVLLILHRRHVRRLKKEDLVAAQIDLNHDDFDMTPPRNAPRSGRTKIYGNDYLLPIGNDFSQSRVSLNSPYDVIPQELARMHGKGSYTALPRAPESAKLRNTSFYQQDSPYDFRNQLKGDNASTKTPSRLSTMTYSTPDVNAARNLPKLNVVDESFEMQEMSMPQSVLVDTPSSDASASSDPIVRAVYDGFQELPQDAPSASDLSSSPPGLSLSPPESIHSLSPTPFPTRSDSVKRLSQRYPRRLSTAPPVPSRESKLSPEDRVSYYEDPPSSESGTDNEGDSSSVENYQETLEPFTLQSRVNTDELIDTTAAHVVDLAPPQDSTSQPENSLRRQRSFSSPADAEERANRLRSFYKDYFDKPMPNGYEPALPILTQDDSAVAYGSTARVPAPRVAPSPNIMSSPTAAAGRSLRPAPRHPIGSYNHFPGEVPRSLSSQSGGPYQQEVQHRREPQLYPAYNSGYYTPQYQPQHHPYMPQKQPMLQRAQPKRLPPLEPLSPLPTPHQLGEERILGSPTLFAPPRRPRAGTAGSSVGSSCGSPTTPQQQWTEMQLRNLPTPYMLRNSASYSGLEFLPPKKYSPSGVTTPGSDVENMYLYDHNQQIVSNRLSPQLPRELVPIHSGGVEDNLRPQWSMRE